MRRKHENSIVVDTIKDTQKRQLQEMCIRIPIYRCELKHKQSLSRKNPLLLLFGNSSGTFINMSLIVIALMNIILLFSYNSSNDGTISITNQQSSNTVFNIWRISSNIKLLYIIFIYLIAVSNRILFCIFNFYINIGSSAKQCRKNRREKKRKSL